MLISQPLGRHTGFQREADTCDRKSVRGYPGNRCIDPNHMSFSIQQRAAGVAAIQPRLRLEYILAFHPVEVVDLCTDHAGGQGPESPLFGMPDGHYMISNPAPVRLEHAHYRQWLRDTLELE